jgi:hypothetical protein
MAWTSGSPVDAFSLGSPVVAVRRAEPEGAGVDVRLSELRPGAGWAKFLVTGCGLTRLKFVVIDVQGRRVRTLLDGVVVEGGTTVVWDGRDGSGSRATSGMYFGRLTWPGGSKVVRVPFLR